MQPHLTSMTISAPLQPSMHRRQILTEEGLAKGAEVEQEEKTFPDIPLDIARLVFEKAMEDSPIPVHLALVSRQVQQWVEPLIYRHLTFHDATGFCLFYRTFRNRRHSQSKSTAFFAKHVKALHILGKATPRMEELIAVGRVLKSLRTAAGWDNSWGGFMLGFLAFDCMSRQSVRALDIGNRKFNSGEEVEKRRDEQERKRRTGEEASLLRGWIDGEGLEDEEGEADDSPARIGEDTEDPEDPFPYKDLRRLSMSAHALRILRLDFTNRMFRDLTHLNIYYCRLYDWSTLRQMVNLTHIAIDFLTLVTLTFTEMKQCMGDTIRFCQNLPQLKAIIFACVDWESKDFDLMDDNLNFLPPLIFSSEDWDRGGPLISTMVDERSLHYFTQLSLGMHDHRVVLGVVSECLQKSHLMRDFMVDFSWPKNSYDWDFTVPKERHREIWELTEEIIERRSRERNERRCKLGRGIIEWHRGGDNRSECVDNEFGFGDVVKRRWDEGFRARLLSSGQSPGHF